MHHIAAGSAVPSLQTLSVHVRRELAAIQGWRRAGAGWWEACFFVPFVVVVINRYGISIEYETDGCQSNVFSGFLFLFGTEVSH